MPTLNPRSWAAAGYCPTGQPYQLPLLKTHASRNQAALSAYVPSYALSQMPIHYQANKAVTCARPRAHPSGQGCPVPCEQHQQLAVVSLTQCDTGPAPRLKSNLCNAEDNDTGTVTIPSPPPHTHTHTLRGTPRHIKFHAMHHTATRAVLEPLAHPLAARVTNKHRISTCACVHDVNTA